MNDNINLKPLPLPIFTVGDDANISDICKFHYLKGCLKEEALRAIESLSISGENYMNAINVLRKRFENKRLIVNQHVTNILNIQPLLKSSFTELRTLIDTVNNNIAALKVLQYQPGHWDPFLEGRFEKDHKLVISYKEFMKDYINMEHMELVPYKDLRNSGAFYLPHLAVYKQTIQGPKIRVVFDCSAKSSNGFALNDSLLTGANLQEGLFDILCRFRTYRFVIAADITKISDELEYRVKIPNDNPADIVSRGMLPRQLRQSELWWHGPQWLKSDASKWPSSWQNPHNKEDHLFPERKLSKPVNIINAEPELPVLQKFSSALSVEELEHARLVVLKYIQSRELADEIRCIQKSKKLKCQRLAKLDPFIDKNGLLRVGGRLKHSLLAYESKFPILLPEKHHVTKSIIRETHEDELHAGNEATLAAVRQRYWPISGRNFVRKIIHSCVKCNRANPKPISQKMGDLPKERLQPSRPFSTSGVDYAGPYLIKSSKLRNAKKVKSYIARFVCFSTKAVHLELVGDLTTESFLAAFKRFTSRRGHVSEIFSDNGSNFVGAERELFKTTNFKNKIECHFLNSNTSFNFIPARSPHFGGLWERAIQSVKRHLKRVLGDASITYEEFYTLLTRVEACLNSRPIIPLSQDPNDLEALTPGHFLIGAPLTAASEIDITSIRSNRLSRWQRIQQIQQHFWKRWQREYLSQLQKRPKGQQVAQPNVSVGMLVVLVGDNLPPLQWRLGRVVEVHPGADNIVRVVSIKTISGVDKRAIKKVCVLPTEVEQ
ncbi:hypothetical protein GEV33_015351 [Tenebrio molitor]|uniref:Integrase catalytic domain-containing protein n=1 Tax=Tenebrio molitor TaxID=7067 RepID=A0A8J6L414_TENMO|nr:hypothetical protein GEV33_015351 [Tenebrio molitor]